MSRLTYPVTALLALLACACLLSACGGGDPEDQDQEPTTCSATDCTRPN